MIVGIAVGCSAFFVTLAGILTFFGWKLWARKKRGLLKSQINTNIPMGSPVALTESYQAIVSPDFATPTIGLEAGTL